MQYVQNIFQFLNQPIISALLIAIGLFLFKNFFKESISFKYKQELEKIKSELSINNEKLKSLSEGMISTIVYQQNTFHNYRVEAAKLILKSIGTLYPAKNIATMLKSFKIENLKKEKVEFEKIKILFNHLEKAAGLEKMEITNAKEAQLFISKEAWEYYSLYLAITSWAILVFKQISLGIDDGLIKENNILKDIEKILPHHKSNLDKIGISFALYLLDEIEEKLMVELEKNVKGIQSEEENLLRVKKSIEKIK